MFVPHLNPFHTASWPLNVFPVPFVFLKQENLLLGSLLTGLCVYVFKFP